ncbi:SWIM zinc finger family protein [Streptococcus loxodontisalivarius]|uniref:Zn finger protein n=1 Tax=Streptococcus loxodontisalivarius TaxID=1349415 RepID=A0ABS2PTG4_9STRE|nr:SWIM zinc finger family protein [Streptococcus loxodontisalivarius]MBM7643333.1 putative Zn finger protein [Streptococcus loxodontisalivarius]
MGIWDDLKLVHLASNTSFSRGMAYYQSKEVLNGEKCGDGIYKGQVSGSQENIYDVTIDINHPRKSSCSCPFSSGRRVICKHMVALYFYHFPQQAEAIFAEWEEEVREKEARYQEWESEYTIARQQELKEITAYVKSLTDEQVREALIAALLKDFNSTYPDFEDDFDEEDYYF